MLRMCMPLASLHGDHCRNTIDSRNCRQQTRSAVHVHDGRLAPQDVQAGVGGDGCSPTRHSPTAVTLQQLSPRCQQHDLMHLSALTWLQHASKQQQQQQQQQQQRLFQLLALQHKPASLMRGLIALQQPLPLRAFSTSPSTHSCSIKPQLHQPMKHVSGTDPLKTLRVSNSRPTPESWANSSSTEQHAAEAAAAAAEPGCSSSSSSSWVRIWDAVRQRWQAGCSAAGRMQQRVMALPWGAASTAGMKAGVCVTGAVAVYIIFQQVALLSSSGGLAASEPRLQCLALSRLNMLLWRPGWWPAQWAGDAAQHMADRGLLTQLAALVKPGTDAVVLNEVFLLLQRLLELHTTMAGPMQEAGISEALSRGLQEGWLPRGALDAAAALQDKLQSPAKQPQQKPQQQQQQGQRRLPPVAAVAPAAVATAQRS